MDFQNGDVGNGGSTIFGTFAGGRAREASIRRAEIECLSVSRAQGVRSKKVDTLTTTATPRCAPLQAPSANFLSSRALPPAARSLAQTYDPYPRRHRERMPRA